MKTFSVEVEIEVEAADAEAAEDLVLDILNAETAFADISLGMITEVQAVV